MDTNRFNAEHAAKSRAVCERIEREDAECRGKLADLVDAQLKGELGRAKAEADGWRKIAERRLKHTDERERQILDMWPRFEDGEYVWFGDVVKLPTCGAISVEAIEFSRGEVCVKDAEDGDWNTSIPAMQPLKRPVPKVLDADGVEIKFGDTVWDGDGVEMVVMSLVGELPWHVTTHSKIPPAMHSISPKRLTHTRPDSWERLEEDAAKEPCDYFGVECDEDKGCSGCPHLHKGRDCTIDMQADLIRRAKALAGAEVSE